MKIYQENAAAGETVKQEDEDFELVATIYNSEAQDIDYLVPIIDVQYKGQKINGVLLDGGSEVNILSEHCTRSFVGMSWSLHHFKLRWQTREESSHWELYGDNRSQCLA